jgi:hypothetical protein
MLHNQPSNHHNRPARHSMHATPPLLLKVTPYVLIILLC